ncbi:MAG: hypothetical protein P3B98_02235 [Gemmatimonadota bacterium]|nr:hypothetical protein [Gemmatimonadota bacterium]
MADAIVADRAMYADGANFFLGWRLAPGDWIIASDAKHPRLFVNALNQGPAILARFAGVTDLNALRLWFGAGLFAAPLLIFGWCVALGARAADFRVALAMGAGTIAALMPSQIFILEQAITTTALAWMLLSYQVLPLRWRWYDIALVATASFVLLQSHETILVEGTILGLLALEAVRLSGWRQTSRQTLYVGAVGFAVALHVIWWMHEHPILSQTSNFLGLWYVALPWELWRNNGRPTLFLLVVAPLAILGAMHGMPTPLARRWRRIAAWVGAIGAATILAGALTPWLSPEAVAPRVQFDLRVLIPFVSAAFMALAGAWVLAGPDARAGKHTTLKVAIAVALLGGTSWQFANTAQWRQFDGAVRTVLTSSPAGEVDPELVRELLVQRAAPNAWRMQWEWAWGFLSLARLDQPRVSVIIVPTSERQSFRSPRTSQDSLHLPWLRSIPPDGVYRLDALAAACAQGRCGIVPAPPQSVR